MAVKIIRKGNSSISNDHNTLYNRGLTNQHPIEAITGLAEELAEKYVKPETGIPSTDLGFEVVNNDQLLNAVSLLEEKILTNKNNISVIDKRADILEDLLNQISVDNGVSNESTLNFAYKEGFREDFISEDGDTVFNLTNSYIVDGEHLMVYRDGELLSPNIDYEETADNEITMKYPLEADVIMTFICTSMSTVLSPIHEEVLSIEDQKVFVLKNKYNVGEHSLSIFVNGLRLECNKDYIEIDGNTVELKTGPYPSGTNFIFRQEIVTTAGKVLYHGKDYNQKSWSYNIIATEGQREISVDESFIPGANMINVMCNGLLQWQGEDNDYIEVNEHTIMFNYDLEEGEHVRITCVAATCEWTERFIATKGQTVFKLKNPYHVGVYDIQVYENGLLLQPECDYEETNYNTITFTEEVEYGAKVTFIKRR